MKDIFKFSKILTFKPPPQRRWTASSIQCYKRGCVCKGCQIVPEDMRKDCRIKCAVNELIKSSIKPTKGVQNGTNN